jgi:hypothetical protein
MFQTTFVETITTHNEMCDDCNLISPENRAVYDIMWKNIAEPDRPQMTI